MRRHATHHAITVDSALESVLTLFLKIIAGKAVNHCDDVSLFPKRVNIDALWSLLFFLHPLLQLLKD